MPKATMTPKGPDVKWETWPLAQTIRERRAKLHLSHAVVAKMATEATGFSISRGLVQYLEHRARPCKIHPQTLTGLATALDLDLLDLLRLAGYLPGDELLEWSRSQLVWTTHRHFYKKLEAEIAKTDMALDLTRDEVRGRTDELRAERRRAIELGRELDKTQRALLSTQARLRAAMAKLESRDSAPVRRSVGV